jgi:NADH-quinone oxidoreductase subunit C/D
VFGGGTGRAVDGVGDVLDSWPEDDRTVQSNVPRTLKPQADAETYRAVEGATGELGIYLRSDGTDSPARFKIRRPCFRTCTPARRWPKASTCRTWSRRWAA